MAYVSNIWRMRLREIRSSLLTLDGAFRMTRLAFPRHGLVIAPIAGIVIFLSATHSAQALECPNEAMRVAQFSTQLPGCRAYELVSPPDGTPYLDSQDLGFEVHSVHASSAGKGIAWFSYDPLSSSPGGGFYDLSTRTSSGWTTQSISPHLSTSNGPYFACVPAIFFSANLSMGVLMDGYSSAGPNQAAEKGACGSNNPPLVANEPEGFQNVFLRDNATGGYRLVNVTPAGVPPADAVFQDASEDFSHIVFEEVAELAPGAPVGASLYEWTNGVVNLVTVLPDGAPTTGSLPEAVNTTTNLAGAAPYTNSVSADGTSVVFESPSENKLFLRENVGQAQSEFGPGGECVENAMACTVQLDASQAGGAGGGGSFVAANTSGTKIFFIDGSEAMLTADTPENSAQNLYEYDTVTGKLSDLTPAGNLEFRGLGGISQDGSYLYLTAEASLDGGIAHEPNLYVLHAGTVKLIATLASGDEDDWRPTFTTARVSSDGRYFAFDSVKSLGTATGGLKEIYLYDAVANALRCVSCDPGGTPPSAQATIAKAQPASESGAPNYLQRQLLDDGRVFFNTATPLVASAINGKVNVYEYDGGHLGLISSGASDTGSYFYDASQSGEDVFFVTTQHLVGGDTANGMRLFDARVDGGFPEPTALRAPCGGEECRGPASERSTSPPVVTAIVGASGNVVANPTKKIGVSITRKQRLERALRACRRDRKLRKRVACMRRARVRYRTRSALSNRGGGK